MLKYLRARTKLSEEKDEHYFGERDSFSFRRAQLFLDLFRARTASQCCTLLKSHKARRWFLFIERRDRERGFEAGTR